MTVWPLYGLASAAALGFAALCTSEERHDRIIGALTLALGWAAANQIHFADWLVGYALLDMLVGYMVIRTWLDGPEPWKLQVFACTILQLFCHVIYQAALCVGNDNRYAYQAALNALFVCQLLAVSSAGIKRGIDYINRCIADGCGGVLRIHGMARNEAWLTRRTSSTPPRSG